MTSVYKYSLESIVFFKLKRLSELIKIKFFLTITDFYAHFINNSPYLEKFSTIKKDEELGNYLKYVGKVISSMKRSLKKKGGT